MKPFPIFRPGTHRAMSGRSLAFSACDLAATARAYDPARHEAPIVVGHPTTDAPAYGWIKGLSFAGEDLVAEPHQVDPLFAELVKSGRYKKVSASFYEPDAPQNPTPGVYALRHVGFLGAAAPAVKGLKAISFAGDEAGTVTLEFGETDGLVARIFRSLREWILGRDGMEAADRALPGYLVDELAAKAAILDAAAVPAVTAAFTETAAAVDGAAAPIPTKEDSTMDPKELERRAQELDARQKSLDDREASFSEREKGLEARDTAITQAERRAREEGIASFCDKLVAEGRLMPVLKTGLVAFMAALPATGVIEFGEGEDKKTQTPLEFMQGFLAAQPKLVEFGEVAGGETTPALDGDDPVAIAKAATAWRDEQIKSGKQVSYAEAVQHVVKEQSAK